VSAPLPSPFDLRALSAACRSDLEVARAVVERAHARGRALEDRNAFIHLCEPADLAAQLEAAITRLRAGENLPLFGVPYAVKDNIDARGLPTTAACPGYAYTAEADAFVVGRLRDAGAILVGKTNMDQFATGLVGTRSPYGACASAFDRGRVSGGSSSGSALAVALGAVSFALGTDTAGSGRVPAAFNNIVGLKPTRGLLSTTGVVPACRSLDCVSVFAGCAPDAGAVLDLLASYDAGDAYARRLDGGAARRRAAGRVRLGVPRPAQREFYGDARAAAMYEAALARLPQQQMDVVEIDFEPFARVARLLYETPFVAERYAAVGGFMESADGEGVDPTVRAIILGAREQRASSLFEAMHQLRLLARQAEATWGRVDALLLPTAPTHPTLADVAAEPIHRNAELGHYTNFVNLLDLCGIAVPAGFREDGLPFGVTLLAPAMSDWALLDLAQRLHRLAGVEVGASGEPLPDASVPRPEPDAGTLQLAVCGAHLLGQPLHHQLSDRDAVLVERARTAACYRFYALDTAPPKPGLVYTPGFEGPGIEVEVWSLTRERFGDFVSEVPAPLSIGKVTLADGREVSGFLCEPRATEGARDITRLGGWRRFVGDA
jgi:allophanate hydrolase